MAPKHQHNPFLCLCSGFALFASLRSPGRRQAEVPRYANLPARLLAARLRPFRVEADDLTSGKRRVFAFHAKHAGIALTKARTWGLDVKRIDALPTPPAPRDE